MKFIFYKYDIFKYGLLYCILLCSQMVCLVLHGYNGWDKWFNFEAPAICLLWAGRGGGGKGKQDFLPACSHPLHLTSLLPSATSYQPDPIRYLNGTVYQHLTSLLLSIT
jgi:hypothetical protein